VKPFRRYYYEKNVVNLIEPITIEGVGTVESMADSGNSAFNVLDGRGIQINGDKVQFVSTAKNLSLQKDIADTIVIHIGSGVNEDRPIVEFDIVFKGKKYNKVKFSIADRSKNETPVLLGREFLKSLNALIDINSQ
jgi:hypothetical protein